MKNPKQIFLNSRFSISIDEYIIRFIKFILKNFKNVRLVSNKQKIFLLNILTADYNYIIITSKNITFPNR